MLSFMNAAKVVVFLFSFCVNSVLSQPFSLEGFDENILYSAYRCPSLGEQMYDDNSDTSRQISIQVRLHIRALPKAADDGQP